MIPLIILCAGLCALICLWVLKPLRTPRAFYGVSILCAVAALGIYLVLGSPDLPGHPFHVDPQAQADMKSESQFMMALQKNPDDEDALVRLAALRVLQGRTGKETLDLLDHAQKLNPKDRRVRIIRGMILVPAPKLN
jgi:cytochrome c-type biogenesis protein CcmH/NrfG